MSSRPSSEVIRVTSSAEAIATLDQTEHAFAFADAARAANQNAHPQNVHHAAELGYGRRKIDFECNGRSVNEFHRDHRRTKHRDIFFGCNGKQGRIEMESTRDNEARNFTRT